MVKVDIPESTINREQSILRRIVRDRWIYLMLLPGIVYLII
jgi:ABC-type polysaccharide transport system permease subunit